MQVRNLQILFTSPEMEFLNGIFLVEVSGHKLKSCLDSTLPSFSVLLNAIYKKTRVFQFCEFFCEDFENQRRVPV